jgi:hypothetical protein
VAGLAGRRSLGMYDTTHQFMRTTAQQLTTTRSTRFRYSIVATKRSEWINLPRQARNVLPIGMLSSTVCMYSPAVFFLFSLMCSCIRDGIYTVQRTTRVGKRPTGTVQYCELHHNRPKFALFRLFSGAVLQIAPAQSDFQSEIGRLLCNSQSQSVALTQSLLCDLS